VNPLSVKVLFPIAIIQNTSCILEFVTSDAGLRIIMSQQGPISAKFPFESHFIEIMDSRIHYIDEGTGDPIVFLHGNPTSSYLWRNIIPYLSSKARIIAPDLIGMGKSAKPNIEYKLTDHIEYIENFINALSLKNITLVVHDWGSAIGFYYAMKYEQKIKGLAFMEAVIFELSWETLPEKTNALFKSLRTPGLGWELIETKNYFVERVLPGSVMRTLNSEEMSHYREPFKNPADRLPTWRWPNEIPIEGNPREVVSIVEDYRNWLQKTDLPKLLFYVSPGALIGTQEVKWLEMKLKNLTSINLGSGIHFIQEDHPDAIGMNLATWHSAINQ